MIEGRGHISCTASIVTGTKVDIGYRKFGDMLWLARSLDGREEALLKEGKWLRIETGDKHIGI